eukprot:gnl/MRDRNA2_/MRDRNA2_128981_c0_seq1.p1 gnl/MRDRNA2_/MRDRNA2_128981_c0~~gnl/MRDRNA2_/MRDRNA2_128981_c0_seq1.p1  ORF type:complete len:415 (-),score=65.77 gnl/MRDRNA2_/MRDRNA2_128981_c0_seq1:283-1527(-)
MENYRSFDDVQGKPKTRTAVFQLAALVTVAGVSFFAGTQMSVIEDRSTRSSAEQSLQMYAAHAVVHDPVGGPGAPRGKQVVVGMDTNINLHVAWNDWAAWDKEMAPYWTEDAVYDFCYVGDWDFGPTKGLPAWFKGEHMHFNKAIPDSQWQDFIRAATDQTCTSATYGLAFWKGPFAGVPPPAGGVKVRIRDLDFYQLEGNRIKINWCLVDVVDLFQQAGYQVLPPSPLSTLGYKGPNAMDGLTAPLSSMYTPDDAAASLKIWKAALAEDYDHGSLNASYWADDVVWYGPGGVGTAQSRKEYVDHWLRPLKHAFSNTVRKTDLVLCEGPYCGAHFYVWGDHKGRWLGEEATGKRVPLRCGAHAHIVDGKIIEAWLIVDVPRTFHAMGVDFYGRAMTLAAEAAKAAEKAESKLLH